MADSEAFRSFDLSETVLNEKFPSVAERYFTRKYKTGVKLEDDDMCILVHTNKVCCVVTVAPSHPLRQQNRQAVKVDFQITNDTNRLDNKVTGKTKKGGQWLHETSRLCTVTCDDGSVFTLYSGLAARLVEVNQRLVDEPRLLTQQPECEGYLAIVLVKLQDYEKTMNGLLSVEQYQELLASRQNKADTNNASSVSKEENNGDTGT